MSATQNNKQGQTFVEKRVKKDYRYWFAQLKTRRGIIVVVSVVFTLFTVTYLYGEIRPNVHLTEEQKYTDEFLNGDNSDENLSRLVAQYGGRYDELVKKVIESDPSKWDKVMLDDACAALLYADKVGAYAQVNTILSFMDVAKANGLNINNNSYGLNNDIRESIKQRAQDNIQKSVDNSGGAKVE